MTDVSHFNSLQIFRYGALSTVKIDNVELGYLSVLLLPLGGDTWYERVLLMLVVKKEFNCLIWKKKVIRLRTILT